MNLDSILKHNANTNVNDTERILSAVAGAFLLVRALKKRNLGILNTAAAGYLLYRGISGNCPARTAIQKKMKEAEEQYSSPADPLVHPVEAAEAVK